jgi:hypothetical protein
MMVIGHTLHGRRAKNKQKILIRLQADGAYVNAIWDKLNHYCSKHEVRMMSSSHLDNKITWWRNWVWLTCVWTRMTIRNSCSSNQWWKSYCSPCLYVAGLALERKVWQATRCADSNSKRAADGNGSGGKRGKGRWWSLQVKHTKKVYRRDQATTMQARDERHGPAGKRNQGRDEKFDGVLTDVAWPTTSRSIT